MYHCSDHCYGSAGVVKKKKKKMKKKKKKKKKKFVCLLVGYLTPQQHASVSQGRICTDKCTCCHTEIEVADQTFHLTQSQYTDTGPTSPSADPIMPGAWQGSHWSANVTGMTRPRKNPGASGFEPGTFRSRGGEEKEEEEEQEEEEEEENEEQQQQQKQQGSEGKIQDARSEGLSAVSRLAAVDIGLSAVSHLASVAIGLSAVSCLAAVALGISAVSCLAPVALARSVRHSSQSTKGISQTDE